MVCRMSEDAYISFAYPHCGAELEFMSEMAGTPQACPHCSEEVIVPAAGGHTALEFPLPATTPRLRLRRMDWADFDGVLEILSDPEVFRYDPRPAWDEGQAKEWLHQTAKGKLADEHGQMVLAIENQSDATLVGLLWMAYKARDRQQAILDIQIKPACQRQGFATEAILASLNLCFCGLGLHRVAAACHSGNTAAARLFAKVGMRKEGESVKNCQIDGQWVNTLWFAQLREEFLQRWKT
jgi:RimJ/RimL family protein N-acetyltransferase